MRVRIRFAKLGKVRWTSHRDLARMWERAFRRVGLPLAYTSGFSPRPRVSFGLALPTGHESVAEYLDIELTVSAGSDLAVADLPGLVERLSAALPTGVDAFAALVIDAGTPSLQEDVSVSTWRWAAVAAEDTFGRTGAGLSAVDLAARVDVLLGAETAVVRRHRKGAEVLEDIRPAIVALRVMDADEAPAPLPGAVWLEADLASQPRSIRPSDVLAALGPSGPLSGDLGPSGPLSGDLGPSGPLSGDLGPSGPLSGDLSPVGTLEERDVRRLHQWISRDGARWEPIPLPTDATSASHAWERAS